MTMNKWTAVATIAIAGFPSAAYAAASNPALAMIIAAATGFAATLVAVQAN